MLKIVVRMERARPAPLLGDDFMGEERFWQMRGRNLLRLVDWRTRWTRRLYAAMNSISTLQQVFQTGLN